MLRLLIHGMALVVALGGGLGAAHAQYKWQTPDGGIVYSDLPPPPGVKLITDRQGRAPAAENEVQLPFALKTAASKYPVVLYTAPDCPPCKMARDALLERGVPFSEKTVSTTADFDAFKRVGFADTSFPAVSVGNEKTSGFEAGALARLLDSAGYPKGSMLPPQYKRAEAQPMTEPAPQKVSVSVRQETAPGADGGAGANGQQSAIERYRRSLQQAGEGEPKSSIRF